MIVMQQYYTTTPHKAYQKQGVLTASPVELIVMLFDGCIKDLKIAHMSYTTSKNVMKTHERLINAQAIVQELISSLDMNIELSGQLLELYLFLNDEIAQANMRKDVDRLLPVIEILETLRDTWKTIAQESRTMNSFAEHVL